MEDKKNCCCGKKKLSVCGLGFAIGLTHGIAMFLVVLAIMHVAHGAMPLLHSMSALYVGVDASFVGALSGLAWGFVFGYIYGALIAVFYNLGSRLCPCKSCQDSRCCTK